MIPKFVQRSLHRRSASPGTTDQMRYIHRRMYPNGSCNDAGARFQRGHYASEQRRLRTGLNPPTLKSPNPGNRDARRRHSDSNTGKRCPIGDEFQTSLRLVTSLISTKQALNLSSSEVAFAVGTVYLLGEVAGALFFGRLSGK